MSLNELPMNSVHSVELTCNMMVAHVLIEVDHENLVNEKDVLGGIVMYFTCIQYKC